LDRSGSPADYNNSLQAKNTDRSGGSTACRAVLTGDIVRSALLLPAQMDAVRASLLDAVQAVKGWKRGLAGGRPEFFRGDGWQVLLTDPAFAMRAAIFLRASLLS